MPYWGWAWGVILVTTLLGVIGFARAGSVGCFWKPATVEAEVGRALPRAVPRADLVAPIIALALLAALSAGAGWATAYGDAAAAQVLDRASAAPRGSGGGRGMKKNRLIPATPAFSALLVFVVEW